jgi:hypothetical protein
MLSRFCWAKIFAVLLLFTAYGFADAAAFDLSGPKIEVKVTRTGKTLPISQVPNLQAGDRVWVHPVMPAGQAVHFLLTAVFLRGSTNPPPENWFIKAETWTKEVSQEGIVLTVPQDAQQTVLLLAPQSGGDFGSLRSAVRGKPGAFVRAAQDLYQASLDRSRLDKYLEEVKATAKTAPEALHQRSLLLARSLNIKVDEHCFDKPTEQQAPCLMQNSAQLVLDDGHSQSMVATLTSGASADLIGQISSTKPVGGGSYSPYVGAVVDVVRLMDGFHTPNYQYIPALALPKQNELNLRLNSAPSFKKPKSVLVIGLPAIDTAKLPPLRRVEADRVYCLQKATQALEVEGAPLVYATDLAHDLVLHVIDQHGKSVDLPAKAEAAYGGFLVDTKALASADLEAVVTGTLQGYWGFDRFDGPTFALRNAHPVEWIVPATDKTGLIVGRANTLHLQSDEATCVEQVNVKPEKGQVLKTSWKLPKPNELEVEAPLKDVKPGPITLLVKQYGTAKPDEVPLQAYSEIASLERFAISTGDQQGLLTGTRLDEVASLELGGVRFVPSTLSRKNGRDELQMTAPSPPASPAPNEKQTAHVTLKDGRTLEVTVTVGLPRPRITVLSKNVQPGPSTSARYIRLANQDDLPQDWRLSFFFRSDVPAVFPRDEKVEIANADGSLSAKLSLGDGSLVLQDSKTLLGAFDPLKSFGPSAFGALRVRPVAEDGTSGEWQPLVNLIRVPSLKEVRCPEAADQQCTLQGTNLFFLESVASDAQFAHAVPVPQGFAGTSLRVPRPEGTLLYLKLRDDPSAVNRASLPVLPEP